MGPWTYTPEDVLRGDVDVEAKARGIPLSYVVKGMFFSRLRARVGDSWSQVESKLARPPRLGYFVPFTDYLQADYMRVASFVAAKTYPQFPLREALRRLARDDFGVFADSTFGKVVLAAVGDVHKALMTAPMSYSKMASGDWVITGTEVAENTVRIEFFPDPGAWEYQLGQFEGLVLHYRAKPVITVSEPEPNRVRFDIRHD